MLLIERQIVLCYYVKGQIQFSKRTIKFSKPKAPDIARCRGSFFPPRPISTTQKGGDLRLNENQSCFLSQSNPHHRNNRPNGSPGHFAELGVPFWEETGRAWKPIPEGIRRTPKERAERSGASLY